MLDQDSAPLVNAQEFLCGVDDVAVGPAARVAILGTGLAGARKPSTCSSPAFQPRSFLVDRNKLFA
jgi:hypothetical protein